MTTGCFRHYKATCLANKHLLSPVRDNMPTSVRRRAR